MSDTNDNTLATDTPKPYGTLTDDEILAEARKRRKLCADFDSENREKARDDLLFLEGGDNQWPKEAVNDRRRTGRPVITVNSLPTYLHQVTNDQRQNTPSIKVSPVDSNADPETAQTIQGLIRHIEYDSNADVAYDTAVNSAAAIGFGYFRLITKYYEENSFDQDICFDRIRNALSVRIDPFSKEPDGSDMQFAFVEELMSRDEFKRMYPDANANNTALCGDAEYASWLKEDSVLVTDYYHISKEEVDIVQLASGWIGFASEAPKIPGDTVVRSRKGDRSYVIKCKITAVDKLEEREIKCKWIPVFPVYGDEIDIEGRVSRSGIIRHAKGPAQSYNVFITAATEEVAMRPKAKYMLAEGQEEGHEDEWQAANVSASPFITYKPTSLDGKLTPAPMRQPLADVPSGMLSLAMHASDNIKKTTGLFDASLGARGTATSGKQEIAQQREGDMANYHYFDGLIRAIRHAGRCIVSMLPFYYDAERTVRIMGEDNTAQSVTINQPNVQGKPLKDGRVPYRLNDLTIGKYDITVSAGPSYSTMRQESAEFFTNAMQAAKDPATASIVTYLAMKNQDVPGGDVAVKMFEKLLPPPAQQVLQEENADKGEQQPEAMVQTPQGPIPAQAASQLIMQMMQGLAQAQEQLKAVDLEKQKEAALKQQEQVFKQQEQVLKQQEVLQEQQLQPQKMAVAQMELEAQIAEANAKAAQAEAQRVRAELELEKTRLESLLIPDRMRTEAAQAEEKAIIAARPPEKPEPIKGPSLDDITAAIKKTRSKPRSLTVKGKNGPYRVNFDSDRGMTIKAPSGASYQAEMDDQMIVIQAPSGMSYEVPMPSGVH